MNKGTIPQVWKNSKNMFTAKYPFRSELQSLLLDDGYQNNYTYAYPILQKYGFRAAIFMIGSKIEEHTVAFDPAKKSFLSFNELEASTDVFEYHSHTYDLHQKGFEKCGVKYSSALDRKLLENDIANYFAYPFGEKGAPQKYLLQKNGYRMAFSVRSGFVHPGDPPLDLNRLTVTSTTAISQLLQPNDNNGRFSFNE